MALVMFRSKAASRDHGYHVSGQWAMSILSPARPEAPDAMAYLEGMSPLNMDSCIFL
jgi:hypothetical protein